MLVQDFLKNSAERFPDKTALVCGEQRYTYANMLEQSSRLAGAFRAMELRRQDRVVSSAKIPWKPWWRCSGHSWPAAYS